MIIKLLKFLKLLNFKKNFLILIFVFTIYSFIEVISIASLIPFLNSIFNPDQLSTFPIINLLIDYFSINNFFELQIILGFLFIIFIIFTGVIGIFSHYLIVKTTKNLSVKLQSLLLKTYLEKNYQFFLNRKIDDLKKNIITETLRFSDEVFMPLTILISKLFLISFMFIFLMIINFKITLFMACSLIFGYFIFYSNIKKLIHKRGKITFESITGKFNVVNNIFFAIKEIKVKRNYNYFLNEFSIYLNNEKVSEIWNQTLSVIPKFIFEQLIFILLVLTTLYLYLIDNYDIDSIISTIGIFAFAGYKLLPSFQAIYVSIQKIRYSKHSTDIIMNDLFVTKNSYLSFNKNINFKKSIEIKVNKFKYNHKNIFYNFSFKVNKNEFIGITGKSGTGKTTLIDIMSILYPDFEGSLIVDGKVLSNKHYFSFQKKISYITQDPFIFNGSLKKNIILDKRYIKKKYDNVIKLAQLSNFIKDNDKFNILENGRSLSGGQKQRISIARALYEDKELLLMDEITNALDDQNKNLIMNNIKKMKNKTRILITHDKEILKLCDKIYKL